MITMAPDDDDNNRILYGPVMSLLYSNSWRLLYRVNECGKTDPMGRFLRMARGASE
jgi:hypothetical protein